MCIDWDQYSTNDNYKAGADYFGWFPPSALFGGFVHEFDSWLTDEAQYDRSGLGMVYWNFRMQSAIEINYLFLPPGFDLREKWFGTSSQSSMKGSGDKSKFQWGDIRDNYRGASDQWGHSDLYIDDPFSKSFGMPRPWYTPLVTLFRKLGL
jgi:hypothetical protein